jgi:hypothetical protein
VPALVIFDPVVITIGTLPTHPNHRASTMDTEQAVQYLDGLLGRQLRIHTTDSRMFVGIFKCTDAVSNSLRNLGDPSTPTVFLGVYELC